MSTKRLSARYSSLPYVGLLACLGDPTMLEPNRNLPRNASIDPTKPYCLDCGHEGDFHALDSDAYVGDEAARVAWLTQSPTPKGIDWDKANAIIEEYWNRSKPIPGKAIAIGPGDSPAPARRPRPE